MKRHAWISAQGADGLGHEVCRRCSAIRLFVPYGAVTVAVYWRSLAECTADRRGLLRRHSFFRATDLPCSEAT